MQPPEMGYTFGAGSRRRQEGDELHGQLPQRPRRAAVWSAKQKRWLLSMDGSPAGAAEGGQLGPTTFIVQFATVRPSKYHDVNGANTPETVTVGKGRALIFRDGKVFKGAWSRPRAGAVTSYTIARSAGVLRSRPALGRADRAGPAGHHSLNLPQHGSHRGEVESAHAAYDGAESSVSPVRSVVSSPTPSSTEPTSADPGDRHRPRQARDGRDAQGRRDHGRRHRRAGEDRRGRRRGRRDGPRAGARRHPRPGRRLPDERPGHDRRRSSRPCRSR